MVQNVKCEVLEDIQEEAAAGRASLAARQGIWTGSNFILHLFFFFPTLHLFMSLESFQKNVFIFNWKIIALQDCVGLLQSMGSQSRTRLSD